MHRRLTTRSTNCSITRLTRRLGAALLVALATACAGRHAAPAGLMQPDGDASAVRRLVDDFVARQAFTGVVLVARGDRVLELRAWGHADAERDVRTTVDTRYELGSIAKWVASLVVLTLVDRGTLALEAPLTAYLPEYRADTGARLTLHHLLTHTSGLPNDVVVALRADSMLARSSLSSADAVRRHASGSLQFAPGSRFDYAHANWLVVRAIVERATGRPYADVVRDALWRPLGLRASGTFIGDLSAQPAAARGYATLLPVPRRRTSAIPDFMMAAGGVYGSAHDLLVLLHGVYDGPLLSRASRAALSRVYVPAEDYAYGSRVRTLSLRSRPTAVAWHSGSNGAYRSLAVRALVSGWTVVVLNNTSADQAAMGELATAVLHAVGP